MSSQAIRLFFAVGLAFLAGGAIGAWATRAVYGEHEEDIEPMTARDRICAPCAECPVCPPPPSCEDIGKVPTSTSTRAMLLPDGEEWDREKKPGLPAEAVSLATRRVREEAATCLLEATGELRGTVLLGLTVTATGGQGFISDATLIERSVDAVSNDLLENCLVDRARRARFEWPKNDGEAHARLPVSLGRKR